MRLILLTVVTMVAFASNSLLTRLAVDTGASDPYSFALLRVLAGASVLAAILAISGKGNAFSPHQRAVGALSLAVYMIGFSLAYLTLDAGLGALILFGVVQITMFSHSALTGSVPTLRQMTGAAVAFSGLLLVLWPGDAAPTDIVGAAFMVLAGLGWAVYTISGRSAADPLAMTGANFLLCLPVMLLFLLAPDRNVTASGYLLALICGALTSGLGYALWYLVLPQLQQTVAAVVQLSVPVIAIAGGAVLLGEPVAIQVVVAATLVLGGIALAVTSQSSQAGRK
ncbi:DMT family transporter [uncultured Roseobacter sp.]|uniref:DMT family transporter n=1 Tax=uncultured Roseobacter sp. TaxID=114847 RepID=UPI0026215297|nr:DMT family transporter [uncultured Roseobacter sp.]